MYTANTVAEEPKLVAEVVARLAGVDRCKILKNFRLKALRGVVRVVLQ